MVVTHYVQDEPLSPSAGGALGGDVLTLCYSEAGIQTLKKGTGWSVYIGQDFK